MAKHDTSAADFMPSSLILTSLDTRFARFTFATDDFRVIADCYRQATRTAA